MKTGKIFIIKFFPKIKEQIKGRRCRVEQVEAKGQRGHASWKRRAETARRE